MNRRLVAFVIMIFAANSLRAGDLEGKTEAKVATHFNVTAECQMVLLSQKAALALLPELLDDDKIEAAFARLQTMIEQGEAHLEANLVATSEAGKKSVANATEEMRYPTEWDPPHLPNQLPKDKEVEVLKNWPIVGFTPTAFETRNLGPILELEPLALPSGGRTLEAAVTAQHVRFLRWTQYDAGRLPTGERLDIPQPQFHEIKNSSTLRLKSGQRVLLGAHKVGDEEGRMELFLLRVLLKKSE
ncbi:hypothetical protein ACXR0O_27760 [Verrucomicrobiota bacterium sgz303538]